MHLRLDAKTKRTLERAAAYEETSVSDFVLANAMAAAERVIDSHEKITLSAQDWDAFYDALINPPEPNEKLKEAARHYRERRRPQEFQHSRRQNPHHKKPLRARHLPRIGACFRKKLSGHHYPDRA